MAKTIEFDYNGDKYTLEFTRKSIEAMEKNGFRIQDITERPMTTIPELFSGAFLAHHRFVKAETINEIFSHITDRESLFEKLAEMYNEPFEALMGEPEGDKGNLKWNANW